MTGSMIQAPDGSTATYDAEQTRQFYANPSVLDNCECDGCKNYRAAWKPEFFPSDLLETCTEIGIDPAKAFETTGMYTSGDLVQYSGELPFYGSILEEHRISDTFYPWLFLSRPFGTAAFSMGLVAIEFFVGLPWVLSELNPYTDFRQPH